MSIQVAIRHRTEYSYDRPIELGPQVVRLRPAPHCRTPVLSYACHVEPVDHFINWQQDPYGNYLARLLFPERVKGFATEIEVIADMTVINPFDFFLEQQVETFPFEYPRDMQADLKPYLECTESGPLLDEFISQVDLRPRKTIDFLVDLNSRLEQHIEYLVRMEPGVQSCEETLHKRCGSCRDSGWLFVQVLRRLGMAARFASGYLVQLTPDQRPLDGPSGPAEDFTDLHAWAEVYLPGAGWIGLDPTSGLLAGEGHIPLACTPTPQSAAPITGTHEPCEVTFGFSMEIERVHETPRVTLPYEEDVWKRILDVGERVDARLTRDDVRLTMGGEPTFVSVDDMESPQWHTEALGDDKLSRANQLVRRLQSRFGTGGLLQHGQGKWYPGEPLPRWSIGCYWRNDGQPIWQDPELAADPAGDLGCDYDAADRFARMLAEQLNLDSQYVVPAFEDPLYYIWRERRLPVNVDLRDNRLDDDLERARLASIFEDQGLTSPVGSILPLRYGAWGHSVGWRTGVWQVRGDALFLTPGDSPMGYRLPLHSLQWTEQEAELFPLDPSEERQPLPEYSQLRLELQGAESRRVLAVATTAAGSEGQSVATETWGDSAEDPASEHDEIVRSALCVEPRHGTLHVFMPPLDRLEPFLALVEAIESTSAALQTPVIIEGYEPPSDSRIEHFRITPDPGVIEVNVHPAHSWRELVETTTGVYEDARATRLGTEKFDTDGTHTGTGGGNHVVLGGATPQDSPFLRRPDLLKSMVGYWLNHPSLSYLFSGRFVGPTSQAPRVDEGRPDAMYELAIGLEQISPDHEYPPWFVDRVFRHLLVDVTGNTHRAEFCIDKLYSPDGSAGRMGLVELRAFEMPPHARMSLTQQLLVRSLIARFWNEPYEGEVVHWGTTLHDRFMLPHFLWEDFQDVIHETNEFGIDLDLDWYLPHFAFRFPRIGEFTNSGVSVEIRQAIEPWYVLGEEQAAGGTARYVDSSVERLQVLVRGMTSPRHEIWCNGRRLPLHPTGCEGEFVAGVRFRAWQPPSCLHPTIPVDAPLTFDLVDCWRKKSLGGACYHVGHPGGINPDTFPINANEAESRRSARFTSMNHSVGPLTRTKSQPNARFPMTLDLRRGVWESVE